MQGAVAALTREGCQVRVHGLGDQPLADQLFLCAGAYSDPGEAAGLGRAPGYGAGLPHPAPGSGPYAHANGAVPRLGFAATPMAEGLRLAGTVELASLEAPPAWDRAKVLSRNALKMLPALRGPG